MRPRACFNQSTFFVSLSLLTRLGEQSYIHANTTYKHFRKVSFHPQSIWVRHLEFATFTQPTRGRLLSRDSTYYQALLPALGFGIPGIFFLSLCVLGLFLLLLSLFIFSSVCSVSYSLASLAPTARIVVNSVRLTSQQVLSTPSSLSAPAVVCYLGSIFSCHSKS